MLRVLESNGFHIDEAMRYCAGVESIYREVLKSFADEGDEKLPILQRCMENQDFQRYMIEVHGIKNVAQTIGDVRLFEIAMVQNDAMKAADFQKAIQGHDEFMKILKEELAVIRRALKQ